MKTRPFFELLKKDLQEIFPKYKIYEDEIGRHRGQISRPEIRLVNETTTIDNNDGRRAVSVCIDIIEPHRKGSVHDEQIEKLNEKVQKIGYEVGVVLGKVETATTIYRTSNLLLWSKFDFDFSYYGGKYYAPELIEADF